MSNQGKLVEALKTFMEKGVIPSLGQGHPSLSEWKYLNGILSADRIDSGQLDFYLLMANKSGNSGIAQNTSPTQRQMPSYQISKDKNPTKSFTKEEDQDRQKLSFGQSRRKHLMTNMQNFQNNMVKNQEKLESFNKKNPNTSIQVNVSTNSSYANNSKKYL